MGKKVVCEKGKGDDPQVKRELSNRKGETSPAEPEIPEQRLGPNMNLDDEDTTKQTIIDNLHVQIILGGKVFDMDIIQSLGIDSLHYIAYTQSWIH